MLEKKSFLKLRHLIAFVAFVFFCLVSLPNHYHFRTFAFDLGIYNNSVYQYSHLINNTHPMANGVVTNFLGDHFALYTILYSPFYYLFGNYTTLIFQIVAIVFGGYGVYHFAKLVAPQGRIAELAMVQFYFFFGFHGALSFDYHDNVIASSLLPWFLYYIKLKDLRKAIFFAFVIIIGKENMALWMVFVCLGLLLMKENSKDKSMRHVLAGILLFSLVYFVVIIKVVIPYFSASNEYAHLKYSVISNNLGFSFSNIKNLFSTLFVDTLYPENYTEIKVEFYTCLLLAGGFSLLVNYQYLLMLIPIIFQKMYHDEISKWGISCQYSVEFAAVVVVSNIVLINKMRNSMKLGYGVMVIITLSSLSTTFIKMFERKSVFYDASNGNIFCKEHYQDRFDRKLFEAGAAVIPSDAKLCALENFVPHLANRECIYVYPVVNDAEYLYIAATNYSGIVSGGAIVYQMDTLNKSTVWQRVFEKEGFIVYKKKN